jgi:triosephosphate isomerase (TIM)
MAGNWKMYKTVSETKEFFSMFAPLIGSTTGRDIVICPTFVSLPAAVESTKGSKIEIGGQNLHWAKEGAYTGEISGAMLAEAGAKWVLIGHSERRQLFGETNESVLKKTVAALDAGLNPIVCVGEQLNEREEGRTNAVLEEQLRDGIAGLSPEQFAKIAIAYEPVWAIGTGKTATPEIAEEAHAHIRSLVDTKYGKDAAGKASILYGGSVKPDNAKTLMAQPDVDGVLVGGASLDPKSFASIVNF